MNMQPSNLQGDNLILIANSRHQLFFADSLGSEKYSFLKQQNKQMMPEMLLSHPSISVSTRYTQSFISSSSDKKKLLEIKTLMDFHV